MKSGTARKVQDPRPSAVDQKQLGKGGKRRQDRQKPSGEHGSRGFVLAALKRRSQHALAQVGPSSEERQPSCFLGNGIGTLDPIETVMDARASHLRDDTSPLSQRGGLSRGHQMLDHGQNQQLQSSLSRQLTTADKTAHLEVTQPGATARDSTGQQVSSSDTGQAAMATAPCQDRDDDALSRRPPSANRSEAAAERASELLRDTGWRQSEAKLPQSGSGPYESHQNLHPKTQQKQYFQPRSQQVQRRPLDSSMLEEAGRVLHQVQRQKQVLEENLQALLRARSGELLYSQLEALVDNRTQSQKVRIKKMVDTWINTLMQDIQADVSSQAEKKKSSDRKDPAAASHRSSAHALRGPRGGPCVARTGREPSTSLWVAEPDATTGRRPQSTKVEEDASPRRLHGGARRTLKKTPYLRFSSPPSQPSKKSHARVVERVTGVKLKSCKTQTCPPSPVSLPPQSNVVMHPAPLTAADPTHSRAVAMAIPLGRPRTDAASGRPGTDAVSVRPGTDAVSGRPGTNAVSGRPGTDAVSGRPGTDAVSGRPTPQQQEVTLSRTAPPTSPVGAVINVATESQEVPSDAGEESIGRNEESDLLPESVCDVVQDEESPLAEEMVQLDGDPAPPSVQYHGPLFPPQACVALSDQGQAPITTCSPALENQLLEWVEQQLISRMISEMYQPPPPGPDPGFDPDPDPGFDPDPDPGFDPGFDHGDSDQSGHSITSDNILIRQLVEEVLTEHLDLMHQASLVHLPEPGPERPKAEARSHREEEPVPTPQPTPPPSPTPQSRTSQPLATPPPSEPVSLLMDDPPQSMSAPDPVITPTPTPELSPVAADLPAVPPTPPPLVAEEAEVRLVEQSAMERVSAAEEEEASPSPEIPVASHCSLTEDSSHTSNSSSSTTTVGTEAAYKAVSEGELLSHVQLEDTMTEEVLCSFSISLQDTEFDPPSEGQAGGHDHLLPNMEDSITLIEGSNQGWMTSEQQEDVSVGEVGDVHATNPAIPHMTAP